MKNYRSKTRTKAGDSNGQLIFELKHYDIFQFANDEEIINFSGWVKKHEEVELIENGHNFRVGIKYKKGH
jgi:hypothetical protein